MIAIRHFLLLQNTSRKPIVMCIPSSISGLKIAISENHLTVRSKKVNFDKRALLLFKYFLNENFYDHRRKEWIKIPADQLTKI